MEKTMTTKTNKTTVARTQRVKEQPTEAPVTTEADAVETNPIPVTDAELATMATEADAALAALEAQDAPTTESTETATEEQPTEAPTTETKKRQSRAAKVRPAVPRTGRELAEHIYYSGTTKTVQVFAGGFPFTIAKIDLWNRFTHPDVADEPHEFETLSGWNAPVLILADRGHPAGLGDHPDYAAPVTGETVANNEEERAA
jgi:hypothetical protein